MYVSLLLKCAKNRVRYPAPSTEQPPTDPDQQSSPATPEADAALAASKSFDPAAWRPQFHLKNYRGPSDEPPSQKDDFYLAFAKSVHGDPVDPASGCN